jgi:hypothetical protein
MKKYLPLVITLLLAFASAAFAQDATKPTPGHRPSPSRP